jgi:hypothetical protein
VDVLARTMSGTGAHLAQTVVRPGQNDLA